MSANMNLPQDDSESISSFAESQQLLLRLELETELAETALLTSQASPAALQTAGLALLNLTVATQRTGLGGKTLIELELDSAIGSTEFVEHGLRSGDIVSVQTQPAGSMKKKAKEELKTKGLDAVIVRVSDKRLTVALDKEDGAVPEGRLWVVKLANDVTYKRMAQAMEKLQHQAAHSPFVRVLFGLSSPSAVYDSEAEPEFFDQSLNESQKNAIKFAMIAKEIALIHGPPGTGKTHTLIELIRQLVKQGLRVLVCGPSNISVDNVVERLSSHRIPMIRLGHPARLLPSVLNHSLDVLTQTSEAGQIVKDIRTEMDQKQASIRKSRSGKERKMIYEELRELRKDFRAREKRCIENLVGGSKVVLTTLHGSGSQQLRNSKFDVIIIDEASQALEAQCWVPLLHANKAILAGDHLQLPPTIKSLNSRSEAVKMVKKAGAKGSLEITLFDRLLELHGQDIKRMLTVQYRMNEKIMSFPSIQLYEGRLTAADSVKDRLLTDLPYEVNSNEDTVEPLVFLDTQGGEFPEQVEAEDGTVKGRSILSDSKHNPMEAAVVISHVEALVNAGVRPDDIAVITPYNAQLAALSTALKDRFAGIELGSVDGFQGREKDAVILSLVRSNTERDVGFLSEKRRLNVAMTRAKRHLAVVGDSETVGGGNAFLKAWMSYLEEQADLRYPEASQVAQHLDG